MPNNATPDGRREDEPIRAVVLDDDDDATDDDQLISADIDGRLYELMVDIIGSGAWDYDEVASAIRSWLDEHDDDDITTGPGEP